MSSTAAKSEPPSPRQTLRPAPAAFPSPGSASEPTRRRLGGFSLRLRLLLLTSIVLAAITAFLMLYLPAKLDTVVRVWVERRAIGLATVLSSAVAPGLEFDDAAQAQEMLSGLSSTKDAVYGAVRRGNGSNLAAWMPERVPQTAARTTEGPVVSMADGVLHVAAPIVTRSGEKGTLLVGFS